MNVRREKRTKKTRNTSKANNTCKTTMKNENYEKNSFGKKKNTIVLVYVSVCFNY